MGEPGAKRINSVARWVGLFTPSLLTCTMGLNKCNNRPRSARGDRSTFEWRSFEKVTATATAGLI